MPSNLYDHMHAPHQMLIYVTAFTDGNQYAIINQANPYIGYVLQFIKAILFRGYWILPHTPSY